ncbi:DeoR/GlpR family DNA-binding transcription regulator [Brevibacillus migulae]|uniref:DeoR/GlpR family DNA-binding transcription regulator n=1 Tax=Brevibacillus migulae TaxID=1644114 RepID=UPI00106DDFCB|nr:DeoR/GlpR family DNA-binding transcription regulator [Brevibacillus migulae]
MYQEERLAAIIEHLSKHKRVSVQDVCELYGVSRDTARRDLVRLEEQGLILRTRGGAILPPMHKALPKYTERLQMEHEGKRRIAALASSLIKDGDHLMMDASTTVLFTAEQLQTERHVLVTNSIDIAGTFASDGKNTVHLLGGIYKPEHRYVYGHHAIEMLGKYHVDKAVLGTCGIGIQGLTTYTEEESYLLRAMMKQSKQVIVVADHSKFHVRLFMQVAAWDEIDMLVTDQQPDDELSQILAANEVEVLVAQE